MTEPPLPHRAEPLLNDVPDDAFRIGNWLYSYRHSALALIDDHPDDCRQCAHPEHPARRGVVWSQLMAVSGA